jgi:hypothetical protein
MYSSSSGLGTAYYTCSEVRVDTFTKHIQTKFPLMPAKVRMCPLRQVLAQVQALPVCDSAKTNAPCLYHWTAYAENAETQLAGAGDAEGTISYTISSYNLATTRYDSQLTFWEEEANISRRDMADRMRDDTYPAVFTHWPMPQQFVQSTCGRVTNPYQSRGLYQELCNP